MITREADYAVRTVLYLACTNDSNSSVSTRELSESMEIPYRFLRKLVRCLVEAGLVESRRGKGGGLRLRRPAQDISLADVLHVMDPAGIKLNLCMMGKDRCTRSGFCPVHPRMRDLQDLLDDKLEEITFDQLARTENTQKAEEPTHVYPASCIRASS